MSPPGGSQFLVILNGSSMSFRQEKTKQRSLLNCIHTEQSDDEEDEFFQLA